MMTTPTCEFPKHTHTPALARDDASLLQLVVSVSADGEPAAQFSVVQCVHHFKNVSSAEGQTLRSVFLVFKMSSDVEVISSTRCHDVLIHCNHQSHDHTHLNPHY